MSKLLIFVFFSVSIIFLVSDKEKNWWSERCFHWDMLIAWPVLDVMVSLLFVSTLPFYFLVIFYIISEITRGNEDWSCWRLWRCVTILLTLFRPILTSLRTNCHMMWTVRSRRVTSNHSCECINSQVVNIYSNQQCDVISWMILSKIVNCYTFDIFTFY